MSETILTPKADDDSSFEKRNFNSTNYTKPCKYSAPPASSLPMPPAAWIEAARNATGNKIEQKIEFLNVWDLENRLQQEAIEMARNSNVTAQKSAVKFQNVCDLEKELLEAAKEKAAAKLKQTTSHKNLPVMTYNNSVNKKTAELQKNGPLMLRPFGIPWFPNSPKSTTDLIFPSLFPNFGNLNLTTILNDAKFSLNSNCAINFSPRIELHFSSELNNQLSVVCCTPQNNDIEIKCLFKLDFQKAAATVPSISNVEKNLETSDDTTLLDKTHNAASSSIKIHAYEFSCNFITDLKQEDCSNSQEFARNLGVKWCAVDSVTVDQVNTQILKNMLKIN